MDEYITAFETLDLLFEKKELTKNEQLERLFNYYFTGKLNFYYEIYGPVETHGVLLVPDDKDETSSMVTEKLIGFFNLTREYNTSYFKQLLPLEQGEEWIESEVVSGEDFEEPYDYIHHYERAGIAIFEDENKQLWQLKHSNYNLTERQIYPEVAELILIKSQVLNIIQDTKVSPSTQKRQKSTDRHEKNKQEVLNAALYEVATNYSRCIRGKIVSAELIAELVFSNAEKHWPERASVKGIKAVPMGVNRMADHIRDVIKKKL